MIVESFQGNIKSLSSHLASLTIPLEILTATDAAAALSRLEKESPDLIIIDTLLRGEMDGFDFCRAVRKSYPEKIPIILLLSGYLSLERYKGIAAGADLLLQKPVVKEELFNMVQLLLKGRFPEAENSRLAAPANESVRRLHAV
jgi:CheY-like chemotaxis protein